MFFVTVFSHSFWEHLYRIVLFFFVPNTFSNYRKKFIIGDTSEVTIEETRCSGTGIWALPTGGRAFLGWVGARVGVVLSFSIL